MFMRSTRTSRRSTNNVLKVSKELFPRFGAKFIADFYLPSFHHFFKAGQIVEAEYKREFDEQINRFQRLLDHMQ